MGYATSADCTKMAATGGLTAHKKLTRTKSGLTALSLDKFAVTMTCDSSRRLSNERRLSGAVGNYAYTITVPASSTVTAEQASNSIKAATFTPAEIQSGAAAESITIAAPTAITKTDPTVTATPTASLASSTSLLLSFMLIVRALW